MDGILIGCDANQEWLLPWWWKHYSRHNSYPVAFADFGLSEKGLAWCQERMIRAELSLSYSLKPISLEMKAIWEERAGQGIWFFRNAWFKKPFACLAAPFERTCWLDLDCEVNGSLEPLFALPPCDIALAAEPHWVQEKDEAKNIVLPGEISYNSGVIVFRKQAPILQYWAEESLHHNDRHMGDQNALSRVLYLHEPLFLELPAIYNWKKDYGPNPEAVIVHYISQWKLELLDRLAPSADRASPLLPPEGSKERHPHDL